MKNVNTYEESNLKAQLNANTTQTLFFEIKADSSSTQPLLAKPIASSSKLLQNRKFNFEKYNVLLWFKYIDFEE